MTSWKGRPFTGAVLFFLSGALLIAQTQEQLAEKSQHAKQLMSTGRFTEAIVLYQELLKAVPGNPGLRMNLGMAQHLSGQDKEAVAVLSELLRQQPNGPMSGPMSAMCGASYMKLGEPSKALPHLEKASRAMPDDLQIVQMVADAGLMTRQWAAASEALRKLSEKQSGQPGVWFRLGHSYEGLADELYNKLDAQGRGSAYWMALFAETRVKQRQYRGALALYREALKLNNRRDWHESVAKIYEETAHADWARAERTAASKIKTIPCAAATAECHFQAGRFLQAANTHGQTAEALYWRTKALNEIAREAFAKLSQFPDSSEWHEFLAALHRNQGKPAEAIDEWKKALEKRPGDPDLMRELASTMLSNNEFAEAEKLIRQLLQSTPEHPELQWMLGDSLVAQQKMEEAIAPLEKASKLAPGLLPARASLGRALLTTNRAGEAAVHLKAALATDRDGTLHFQLSRAYAALGRTAEAQEMVKKSQQMRRVVDEAEQGGDITPPQQ